MQVGSADDRHIGTPDLQMHHVGRWRSLFHSHDVLREHLQRG